MRGTKLSSEPFDLQVITNSREKNMLSWSYMTLLNKGNLNVTRMYVFDDASLSSVLNTFTTIRKCRKQHWKEMNNALWVMTLMGPILVFSWDTMLNILSG